jgi:hypothetical protein
MAVDTSRQGQIFADSDHFFLALDGASHPVVTIRHAGDAVETAQRKTADPRDRRQVRQGGVNKDR